MAAAASSSFFFFSAVNLSIWACNTDFFGYYACWFVYWRYCSDLGSLSSLSLSASLASANNLEVSSEINPLVVLVYTFVSLSSSSSSSSSSLLWWWCFLWLWCFFLSFFLLWCFSESNSAEASNYYPIFCSLFAFDSDLTADFVSTFAAVSTLDEEVVLAADSLFV